MPNKPYQLLLETDSEQIQNQIRQNLDEREYKLTIVPDGSPLLDVMQTKAFDLVMLDINLEKIVCTDLLKAIKASTHTQLVPVNILSFSADTEPILRSIDAGADDYIFLPINSLLFQTRLKISIERSHMQQTRLKNLSDMSDRIRRVVTAEPGVTDNQNHMIDIDAFLHRVLTEIKGMYNADAGTIYYREEDSLRFVVIQTDSLGVTLGGTTDIPITFRPLRLYADDKSPNYHNIATYVALTGKTINIPDIYSADQFDFSATRSFDAANHYKSISGLTVPLKDHQNRVIGVLQLLNSMDEEGHIIPFDSGKQQITESMCAYVATILSNRLLVQQQLLMSKLENDVQIGRQIQQAFLPTKFPELPGWEISSFFQPAREVAGDFYDAFIMPGDRLGFIIADVCDKGVGAALFMSLMRSLLRAYALQHYTVDWSKMLDTGAINIRKEKNVSTKKVLPSAGSIALQNAIQLTNNYVATYHADLNMFATTFFGVLDPAKGSLLYINGGHCSPMLIDINGNVKARLEPTGSAVGMFADTKFEMGEIQMEPGDTLFSFTDGVTDVRNMAGKLFKEERLLELLQPPCATVQELLSRVKDTIANYMGDAVQFDDITMLGLHRDMDL